MLVLQRKPKEEVIIPLPDGTFIRIVVLGTTGQYIKLGFDAPRSIRVDRREVWEKREIERLQGEDKPPK